MESTDDYIFVGNMKTGTFRYSPRMVEEFGLPGLSSQMPRQCGKRIHPGDQKEFQASTRRSRTDVQSHTVYSTVHEIPMTSGSGCSAAAHMIRDNLGEPNLFAGMITNIRGEKTGKRTGNGRTGKTGLSLPRRRAGRRLTVRVDTGFTHSSMGTIFFTRS